MHWRIDKRLPGCNDHGRKIPVCAVVLALIAVVSLYTGPGFASDSEGLIVRRPMPQPAPEMQWSKEQKLDFFFISQSERRKDLLSLTLLFQMKTRPAKKRFANRARVVRGEVYQFLVRQHPKKNALRYWQSYIQRDLPALLAEKHPDLDIASVKVDQFERL